jgi:hypothetical protein
MKVGDDFNLGGHKGKIAKVEADGDHSIVTLDSGVRVSVYQEVPAPVAAPKAAKPAPAEAPAA